MFTKKSKITNLNFEVPTWSFKTKSQELINLMNYGWGGGTRSSERENLEVLGSFDGVEDVVEMAKKSENGASNVKIRAKDECNDSHFSISDRRVTYAEDESSESVRSSSAEEKIDVLSRSEELELFGESEDEEDEHDAKNTEFDFSNHRGTQFTTNKYAVIRT